LLFVDAIHPDGRVLAESAVGSGERHLIDEMGQRVELRFGFSFRSLRYLQQSR
jgi:hypothetical protein